jgi:hypothetical protein
MVVEAKNHGVGEKRVYIVGDGGPFKRARECGQGMLVTSCFDMRGYVIR